jgi:hypothetical protein
VTAGHADDKFRALHGLPRQNQQFIRITQQRVKAEKKQSEIKAIYTTNYD